MSLGLLLRALWLRGGLVWIVASRYRVVPRRMPGPRFLTRWAIKRNAKHQGRRDGRLGLPSAAQMSGPNPDYPAHLMYLKNQGDSSVRAILEAMQDLATRKGGSSAAIGHLRQLLSRADDEKHRLAELKRRLDEGQEELVAHEQNLAQHRDALADATKRRRGADVWNRGFSRSTRSVLLVFFTVAELPLLALAFTNFFSLFFSVIVSLGVSVAIIFFAYIAGVLLAKRETELNPGDAWMLVAICVGVVSTIVGLSFVRELYLNTNSYAAGVSIGPTWVVVVVFAFFNIMVFGAAALLSKFGHAQHAEAIDDSKRAVRFARREIKRSRKSVKKLRKQVSRSEDRITLLKRPASSTAQRVRASVEQARLAAISQKDFIEECYALYVRENARAQAGWAARRARLRRPPETGSRPTYNRLPEVADPTDEFRALEAQVESELPALDESTRHVESLRARSTTASLDATKDTPGGPALADGLA